MTALVLVQADFPYDMLNIIWLCISVPPGLGAHHAYFNLKPRLRWMLNTLGMQIKASSNADWHVNVHAHVKS